jgi:predicted metal-dependent HD superfamily phosphohydrolase
MTKPDFEAAKTYVLNRLANELPDYLTYHSIEHTRDGVVPAVALFADKSGVHYWQDRLLLLTGAYFHDLGFVYQVANHEEISAEIAREVLPGMGYNTEQIDVIEGIIMATKMPQNPEGLLQEIIADADMDSLGRTDFFEVADCLRQELEALGNIQSNEEWYNFEIQFLSNHDYFTDAARLLRSDQKADNLARLHELLTLTA